MGHSARDKFIQFNKMLIPTDRLILNQSGTNDKIFQQFIHSDFRQFFESAWSQNFIVE